MRHIVLVLSATLPAIAWGQTINGFGIELNASYNSLTYHRLAIYRIQSAQDFPFDDFQPTFGGRLFYRYPVLDKVVLQPFVQYGQLGGTRKSDNPAEYVLRHWSIGSFASYALDHLDVGLAYRANRPIDPTLRAFAPDSAGATTGHWVEGDVRAVFNTWFHNWGVRLAYRLDRWSVAVEGWYTLGRMESDALNTQADFTQNQYTISVGYLILP